MTHLEAGTLVAIRDGALVDGEAIGHLHTCVTCQQSLEAARERSAVIADALASLDDSHDLDRAKGTVRARLDRQREADRRPRRPFHTHLGRAAGVLLLAAGAAYALPGSPLRGWLETDETTNVTPSAAAVEGTAAPAGEASDRSEIEVPLTEGRIRVVLTGAAPGSEVDLVWTDGASARIAAGPDASYEVGVGRAEVDVGVAPVRLEIPRFAAIVLLDVNGRTYLRREGGALEVLVSPAERSEAGIRFTVTEG
jgi:hypothetical protein